MEIAISTVQTNTALRCRFKNGRAAAHPSPLEWGEFWYSRGIVWKDNYKLFK
jgi:hypothetical protein